MKSKTSKSLLTELVRYRVNSDVSESAIQSFLQSLNSPRALSVWILYKNREFKQLVELEFDPLNYNSLCDARDALAATSFLSKFESFETNIDKKEVALAKFRENEALCKETNCRFRNLLLDPNYHGSNVWLLHATTQKIKSILVDFSAEEFADSANWGPGVSTLTKGPHVSGYNKFHLESGITPQLHSFIMPWFQEAYPSWWEHILVRDKAFTFCEGNEVVTVPKNAKTDRVIAIEPGFNLWFQKACGTMIRRRLRRFGVDLNSQSRNQLLAARGSIHGHLATIDFSSASDTIAYQVVRELLPNRWFTILDLVRSPTGTFRGKSDNLVYRWEKFSSMGNGSTFELESLLFYASALAVCEFLQISSDDVSVYGDDVIIPVSALELFQQFCSFLGFKINAKKSFSSTPFRESCGGQFWFGVECRPVYYRRHATSVPSVFSLANAIRLYAHRCNTYGCDSRFQKLFNSLVKSIPSRFRLKVCKSLGDSGFLVNFDEACPVKAKHSIEGYYTLGLTTSAKNAFGDGPPMILYRLRSQGLNGEENNSYPLRGLVKYRLTRLLARRWCDLGPWI